MAAATLTTVEIRHFHLFAGLGGGAKGFNRGQARVGNLQARFRCLGGIDNDPAAMRDFQALAGVPGTVLDLFDREQYRAFHGREPAADWKEATPADIRRAAGNERPHIVFLSAPCKGFSGLLSETKSKTDKYQALNRLTLRGVWLMLEAWSDDPPEMVLFENVPRLATRGRALLDRITAMLRAYGYATAETTHDCGELGGLAQSRKRFLLVARHIAKVPPMLYEPQKRGLRAVGDVLGRMPLPGDPLAGPMHRVPALQWKTWVRLAFVEAGKDWRSLNRLAVHNGHLRDYLVVPEMFGGMLGVQRWDQPSTTITGQSRPSNGNFSIADPRGSHAAAQYQQYGVRRWDEAMGAVTGQSSAGGGSFSVADPRTDGVRHNNVFRVMAFGDTSPTVTGGSGPSAGGLAIADPRPVGDVFGKYAVTQWTEPSGTVISGSTTGQGAFAVADPRPQRQGRLFTKYPVTDWNSPTGTVIGGDDCGAYAVADHRGIGHLAALHEAPTLASLLPAPADHLVALIVAADGTWHRPLTTLEMATLQSLIDPEEQLELDGLSDQAWRERIGNAVPSDAAQAIASEMGRTLLMAMSGETFQLSSVPIWVRQIAVGLAVAQPSAEVAP